MNYQAFKESRDKYARLDMAGFSEYEIYAPLPEMIGTEIDKRLVHSVLELIVKDCPLPGAKIKEEHIVMQAHGGRSRGAPVAGIPSGNDIRKALIKLGYTQRPAQI